MRMENAKREMEEVEHYDYIIINDNLDTASETFRSIIIAERSRRVNALAEARRIFS